MKFENFKLHLASQLQDRSLSWWFVAPPFLFGPVTGSWPTRREWGFSFIHPHHNHVWFHEPSFPTKGIVLPSYIGIVINHYKVEGPSFPTGRASQKNAWWVKKNPWDWGRKENSEDFSRGKVQKLFEIKKWKFNKTSKKVAESLNSFMIWTFWTMLPHWKPLLQQQGNHDGFLDLQSVQRQRISPRLFDLLALLHNGPGFRKWFAGQ